MKTLTNILGRIAIAGAIALNGCGDKNYLTPEDFENVQWREFYNPNGRIWSCYASENIPKNQLNWGLYEEEVRKRNNDNTRGSILLPDLDGDGRVGK